MSRADNRTPDQLRQHYEVERELAARLKNSSRDERRELYRSCYDELFRRVPDHHLLKKKADSDVGALYGRVLKILRRYVGPETIFLEIGAGDCRVALEMAKVVKRVYAVDVSSEIVGGFEPPTNFELILSDGCSIDVPRGSVDVILSNQLIEHVHPEDVSLQLEESYRALKFGGKLLCFTPHRFSGPHDISKHFDEVATGFHLHEYTSGELATALRNAGFFRVSQLAEAKGISMIVPLTPVLALESLVGRLPPRRRRRLCQGRGLSILFERLIVVAEK